jgi:catechol 2,3-dioxygenase
MGVGGGDLLVLVEEAGAAPGGRHAGLYHYALAFETRRELARAVRRVAGAQMRVEATSDHGVCESIYLRDPDDNGIELYADRPRERWPAPRSAGAHVEIFTIALDMKDLMGEIDGEPPRARAEPGLVVGHVHLHVGDVEQGLAFYRDLLGFELMMTLPGAALVSAGGYHHHLAFNVWLGTDVTPRPQHTAGLREWTVLLASREEVAAVRGRVAAAGIEVKAHRGGVLVRDPWETAVVFRQG